MRCRPRRDKSCSYQQFTTISSLTQYLFWCQSTWRTWAWQTTPSGRLRCTSLPWRARVDVFWTRCYQQRRGSADQLQGTRTDWHQCTRFGFVHWSHWQRQKDESHRHGREDLAKILRMQLEQKFWSTNSKMCNKIRDRRACKRFSPPCCPWDILNHLAELDSKTIVVYI